MKRKLWADKVSNLSSQTITCFTQKIGVSMGFAFIARLNKFHPYEIMVVHELERTDSCWLCRTVRVLQMLFTTSDMQFTSVVMSICNIYIYTEKSDVNPQSWTVQKWGACVLCVGISLTQYFLADSEFRLECK